MRGPHQCASIDPTIRRELVDHEAADGFPLSGVLFTSPHGVPTAQFSRCTRAAGADHQFRPAPGASADAPDPRTRLAGGCVLPWLRARWPA